MKRSCQPYLNYINGLPKDLVGEILMRMPIKYAVRTSILSRKWRYAWTELPRLSFDNSFCQGLVMKTKSKTILTIYQVLLLHRGPLDLFKLAMSNLERCPEIDHFVLVVLQAGVKNLALYMPNGEPYELPSSIYTYGQQLESLDLQFCVLKPSIGFNGFSMLVSLKLVNVGVCGDTFSILISHCALLKELFLTSDTNCGCLDIVSFNLEKFRFVGLCEFLSFTNTPKLAQVKIIAYSTALGNNTHGKVAPGRFKLSGRLPAVEDLMLDYFYLKYMDANRPTIALGDNLCHLKRLHLADMCFKSVDEVSTTVCLIKNSKNLERLIITVHTESTPFDVELTKVIGLSDITLDYLTEFHVIRASGSKCELQFIEFILAKSPMMKKCFIRPNFELVGEKGCKFFKELCRFRRVSPHVEVVS